MSHATSQRQQWLVNVRSGVTGSGVTGSGVTGSGVTGSVK